jgi:predicted ester cyclase
MQVAIGEVRMSQERTTQVMRTYLEEAVAKGNYSVIDEFTAEDFIDHSVPENRGPSALVAHAAKFRGMFPDVTIEIEHISGSDDRAVGIWRLKGTQVEPIFGIPATGKVLEFTVASVFTFRDGMLVDYYAIAGALEALMQMGVTLEPATETASA